jgi:RNA polymerase primary sigma factor
MAGGVSFNTSTYCDEKNGIVSGDNGADLEIGEGFEDSDADLEIRPTEKRNEEICEISSFINSVSYSVAKQYFETLTEEELWNLRETNCSHVFTYLFEKNYGLAYHIVRRKYRRFIRDASYEDEMIQEASIGLIRAIEKFNLSFQTKFSTYAGFWIMQRVQRFLSLQERIVSPGPNKMTLLFRYRRFLAKYEKQNGVLPSDEIICDFLRISKKILLRLKSLLKWYAEGDLYFSESISNNGNNSEQWGVDSVLGADDSCFDCFESLHDRENFVEIFRNFYFTNCKDKYKERNFDIFLQRTGLSGEEEITLEELGIKYKITRERVRQIEGNVIFFLKNNPVVWEVFLECVGA